MAKTVKLKAYQRGHRAEWLAAVMLMLKGYRIEARRYKTPVGEIDLIMRRGNLICFIEVKARATREDGLYAVHPAQQQRIRRAAEWWQAQGQKSALLDYRFDLMVVSTWRCTHITHAF